MNLTGEIRMIKWGIIPTAPYFNISVGQKVGGKEDLLVVRIVREYSLIENTSEFHVVCSKPNSTKEFVWKTYNLMPDEIQYFIPDQKHDYLYV